MAKPVKVPLSPATGWTVGTVQGHDLIVVQFEFIGDLEDDQAELNSSPHFVLSTEDAQALAVKLQEAARSTGTTERRQYPRVVH